MPHTYAHYRFGHKCLKYMSNDIQEIVNNNINYYLYGCQGPDIFYYYNLLKDNKVKKYGEYLHNSRVKDTLSLFEINFNKNKNRDASLSYILGYITHFILDSYCYAYVTEASKISDLSVDTIYKQLDEYYYLKDKINKKKFDISKKFIPSNALVKTINSLYDNFDESIYKKIIYDYKTKLFLLNDNTSIKKEMINIFTKLTSKQKNIKSFDENIFRKCFPFCVRCDKYFEIAAIHYKNLYKNYIDHLIKNTELNQYFNHTINKTSSENIEILNTKDEEEFIINKLQD